MFAWFCLHRPGVFIIIQISNDIKKIPTDMNLDLNIFNVHIYILFIDLYIYRSTYWGMADR